MDEGKKIERLETADSQLPWDQISRFYDTFRQDIWYGAADNIETAWPPMIAFIRQRFPNPANMRAVDFGCGAGKFCRELRQLGFNVTGVDWSEDMLKAGRQNLGEDIALIQGDTATVQDLAAKQGNFDLITSIMAVQFVQEEKFREMLSSVKEGGYLVLANHNPARLQELGVGQDLPLADTEIRVPIYQRDSADYDRIVVEYGFRRVFEEYARQSKEFLKKHNIQKVTDNPKYLILGYEKVDS